MEDIVQKPWGSYQILDSGKTIYPLNGGGSGTRDYQVKKLIVNAWEALSLQSHEHRSEIWTVVSGRAGVEIGLDFETKYLNLYESITIPAGAKHRLSNASVLKQDLIVIEVSYGFIDESDIKRYRDRYGRGEKE